MSRFLSESRVPKPLTPFAEPSKACAQLIGIPYSKHPPPPFFLCTHGIQPQGHVLCQPL